MYPVYGGMNSYPYQTSHMPSTQYYHPSWLGVSQMKEDPPSSSCKPESLPPNYGYPAPMQYHSCCTHGQHPTYYNFRPPCSHFPSPPPPYNHFCGGYPPYPQIHPMYYAPPPHYSVEQPNYEYDKSVLRDQHHCCDCSCHPCHINGRNSVKIEEHEPDTEKKKTESLFPGGAKNFQNPIMWIPPEYMMNREQPRRLVENEASGKQVLPCLKMPQVKEGPTETESQDNESSPNGRKPHQSARSSEQDPIVKNGWFPLDLNRIKQLMDGGDANHGEEIRDETEGSASGRKPHQSVRSIEQNPNSRNRWFPLDVNRFKQLMDGGNVMQNHDQENRNWDEKNAHDAENKDQSKQYPIIWIPSNGQLEDYLRGREDRSAGETTAEESPVSNDAPRKLEHAYSEAVKGRATEKEDGSRIGTLGADKKSNVRIIPVKQLEESVDKLSEKDDEHKVDGVPVCKASQDSEKNRTIRQSSLPTKKFKLPPICLRVDPPKKKKGNGSSRSPSPPNDKKQQKIEDSSSGADSNQPNKEIKVKDVEENGAGEAKEGSQNLSDKVTSVENKVMQQADSDKSEDKKNIVDWVQPKEPQAAITGESQQERKQERKVMSDMEAAVAIQSAYRGYNVRRWQPLKKLKYIAKINEEATLAKNLVKDLESRSAVEDKEKVAIGETIMNLLLKLDSVQGLHESIRDVRRSAAKELITLQEKLDNIASPTFSGFEKGFESVVESVEKSSEGSSLHIDNGASERDGINSNVLSSTQSPLCLQVLGSSQGNSTSEESIVKMDSQIASQDEKVILPGRRNRDVVKGLLDSEILEEPGASETVQRQSSIESEESLVNANPVKDTVIEDDTVSGNEDQEANLLFELPLEVVEESPVTMGPVEETVVQDNLASRVDDQEEHQLLLPQEVNEELLANISIAEDTTGQSDVAAIVTENEDQVAYFLSELPIEVVEDDGKTPLIKHDLGASKLASSNDDGKEPNEVKTSGNLSNDQEVDQPGERQVTGNEGTVVEEHENHELLEMSSKETINGQDTGSNFIPANIELPVMEVDSKLPESAGEGEVFAVEPGVQVEGGFEVPPHKENEDEFRVDTVSNVECSSCTTSLIGPFDYNEYAADILSGDQGNTSETVKLEHHEPDVQQSKEKDGIIGDSLDDQSSAIQCTKDQQVDKKIVEENEKLREMLEKLLASGKKQQEVISSLKGKVKDLEKKLAKKKSIKSAKHPSIRVSRSSCGKLANGSTRERSVGIAS